MYPQRPSPWEDRDELFVRARRGDSEAIEAVFQAALDWDPRSQDLLVELACDGSREGFDYLSRWIRPVLKQFARKLFGGRDRAPYGMSDLVQSGLERGFLNMSFLRVRTGTGFLEWMKETLRNRFRDRERRRARRIDEAAGGESNDDAPAQTPGPGFDMQQQEEVERILSKIKNPVDRTIFYLRTDARLEFDEIAQRLNARGACADGGKPFSVDIVGVRFRRARKFLRDWLEGVQERG